MNKSVIALVIIVLLAGGTYWYMQSHPMTASDMSSSTATTGEENGSVKPDTSLVVGETIQGKWQSTTDPKNVIEIGADDTIVWWYDNAQVAHGLYVVFTKENAPKIVSIPLDENAVYMQTTETGAQSDTMNFRITMTPDGNSLTLTYMDRGSATTYTRVN